MSIPLAKILWHSNSPHSPTGYGNQTRLFTPLILEAGYDLTCFSFYGTEGGIMKNQYGITELPRHGDQYGNDIIVADMQFSQSELLITLIDPFVLDPENLKRVNWCAWVPVDCTPLSDENNRSLTGTRFVWSMSKFGHEQLTNAGYKPIYVPHGIDSQAFHPLPDRQEPREKLAKHWRRDLDGKFLVVTVTANKGTPSRKNFFGMFWAFAEFAKEYPDALFYLHTDQTPMRYRDDLPKFAKRFGIEDKIIFPDAYHLARNMYTDSYLNDVYNAADVFMLLRRLLAVLYLPVHPQRQACSYVWLLEITQPGDRKGVRFVESGFTSISDHGDAPATHDSALPLLQVDHQPGLFVDSEHGDPFRQHFEQRLEARQPHETTTGIQLLPALGVVPVRDKNQVQAVRPKQIQAWFPIDVFPDLVNLIDRHGESANSQCSSACRHQAGAALNAAGEYFRNRCLLQLADRVGRAAGANQNVISLMALPPARWSGMAWCILAAGTGNCMPSMPEPDDYYGNSKQATLSKPRQLC